MLRRSRALLVLALTAVSLPAFAAEEETTATPVSEETPPAPTGSESSTAPAAVSSSPVATPATVETKPEIKHEELLEGWRTEVHGYFRAPMSIGISSRPDPSTTGGNTSTGPSHLQLSYGPNRVLDWSYYSFAYTRLQEQDWAELTFHEKKKHIDAAIGWMGYWLSAAGFRNPDAAGVPGIAYLALDTDFQVGTITPNVKLTMGAWWPGYGYFEKYDTFTLGRFRHMGEQVSLRVPLTPDFTATLDQGVGTGRDAQYGYSIANTTPLYAGVTGIDMLAYVNLRLAYEKIVDVSLHYNYEWTRDPNFTAQAGAGTGKAYADAREAHLSVAGGEANINLPYAGHLWISPSFLSVKNGWALNGFGGIEVMHSQSGMGIASNYMALSNSPSDSTGSGSMLNLGFLYENSLSNVTGEAPGSLPDVKVSVFGLMARSSLDLPDVSKITQNKFNMLKYGADATLQAVTWLALMLRYDVVNYDMDHGGFVFSAITGRLALSTHYLSGESIFLQFSHYVYGDKMKLAANWPWNTPLVAGSDVVQGNGGYSHQTPDENVIKLQAQVAF